MTLVFPVFTCVQGTIVAIGILPFAFIHFFHRMKSSFELGGYEKGEEDVKTTPRKTKAVTNPITGDKHGH